MQLVHLEELTLSVNTPITMMDLFVQWYRYISTQFLRLSPNFSFPPYDPISITYVGKVVIFS